MSLARSAISRNPAVFTTTRGFAAAKADFLQGWVKDRIQAKFASAAAKAKGEFEVPADVHATMQERADTLSRQEGLSEKVKVGKKLNLKDTGLF